MPARAVTCSGTQAKMRSEFLFAEFKTEYARTPTIFSSASPSLVIKYKRIASNSLLPSYQSVVISIGVIKRSYKYPKDLSIGLSTPRVACIVISGLLNDV